MPYNGSKVISATQAGKACIQALSADVATKNQMGEDCLTLNIYTPYVPSPGTDNTRSRKSIMVYFYGGSFTAGWSDQADYDGGNLASRGDVIVVTVNYRLGTLGFLTTKTTLAGSQGIQDQILALHWVQQHMQVSLALT